MKLKPKQIAVLAIAMWISYWLAGLGGSFFGYSSPQGLVGSGVFFGLMAIIFGYVLKTLKTGDS